MKHNKNKTSKTTKLDGEQLIMKLLEQRPFLIIEEVVTKWPLKRGFRRIRGRFLDA
jgi:hypothetical protein